MGQHVTVAVWVVVLLQGEGLQREEGPWWIWHQGGTGGWPHAPRFPPPSPGTHTDFDTMQALSFREIHSRGDVCWGTGLGLIWDAAIVSLHNFRGGDGAMNRPGTVRPGAESRLVSLLGCRGFLPEHTYWCDSTEASPHAVDLGPCQRCVYSSVLLA